jgi:hypothetical protein
MVEIPEGCDMKTFIELSHKSNLRARCKGHHRQKTRFDNLKQ